MSRNKRNRVLRPAGDLRRQLDEQIQLLEHHCKSFDGGFELANKDIATRLRVLLYDTKTSKSLLGQLGLKDKRFLNTASRLIPGNLVTEFSLCSMRISGGDEGSKFIPRCHNKSGDKERWTRFVDWWNDPVIKDAKKRTLNRRELVTAVANTDGGGHVDPELEEPYLDLSRNNSMAWVMENNGVTRDMPSPVPACIRQIAHEVLATIRNKSEGITISYDL